MVNNYNNDDTKSYYSDNLYTNLNRFSLLVRRLPKIGFDYYFHNRKRQLLTHV